MLRLEQFNEKSIFLKSVIYKVVQYVNGLILTQV